MPTGLSLQKGLAEFAIDTSMLRRTAANSPEYSRMALRSHFVMIHELRQPKKLLKNHLLVQRRNVASRIVAIDQVLREKLRHCPREKQICRAPGEDHRAKADPPPLERVHGDERERVGLQGQRGSSVLLARRAEALERRSEPRQASRSERRERFRRGSPSAAPERRSLSDASVSPVRITSSWAPASAAMH